MAITDAFNRANGALVGSTTDTGETWLAGSIGTPSGLSISSNQVTASTGTGYNVVNTGVQDGTVQATYKGGGNWFALYARESAAGCYRIEWGNGTIYLERDSSANILGSAGASMVSGKVVSLTAEPGTGGTKLTVKIDGVAVITYTDTSGSQRTGTKFGLGVTGNIGTLLDDFSFTPITTTPAVTGSSTVSVSSSALAVAAVAAASAVAVASAATGSPAVAAGTSVAVASSAAAYADGGAVPVTAGTNITVGSTATAVAVLATAGTSQVAVESSATSYVVIPRTASTQVAITSTAVVVIGEVPASTATGRREGGRARSGMASATWTPAVVQPLESDVAAPGAIVAAAFGPVTMNGATPSYAVSQAVAPRLRTRILVGNRDVSFYRGVPTPEPGYQLAEPLLWGSSAIEFPQIAGAFEQPGVGELKWCAKGKPVVLQRVTEDGTVVDVDYRGVVVAYDTSGKGLRVELGGHGTGRAALRFKPVPIFRDTLDMGRLAWAAIRDLGLRFEPRIGPKTGIRQALWGGMDYLSYISELCAKAFDRDGQWSLMPDDDATYRFARKDTTTVHWTVFNDDERNVAALRSDVAAEVNRVFASGVTPRGQRVRFGVYPQLQPGPVPPYPFDDGRTFGLGTEDADTDTGDGVFVMVRKMWTAGYLSLEDAAGDYDQDVTRALMSLQEDANLAATGNMNPATWDVLFDVPGTGYTLRGSRIEPAAQDYRVRRYNRSSSGQVIGRNPNFEPHRLVVDRPIDFGPGFTRHQMREWSRDEIYRGEDNHFGTITITTGGVLRGDVAPGTEITEADIADVREIRPGQNIRLPLYAGGILLHIAGVNIRRTPSGHPVAELTVDTQARDAMPIWEMIRRNRETRRDPARRWTGNRASSQVKDSIDEWDEIGGVLYGDVRLHAGWNVVPVVAGQEGTVSRLRLMVQDLTTGGGDVAITGREFACAVFGKKVTPKRLRTLVGNPLAASPDSTAEPLPEDVDPPATDPEADGGDPGNSTSPNRPWWERKDNVAALRDLDLLYSAGTHEEPCGYDPGKKTKGATKTGLHRDDAGFSYRTRREPVLYLAVWVWGERTLSGGRVMWPQLEAGA